MGSEAALDLAQRIYDFLIRSHRETIPYEERKATEEYFANELRALRGES